MRAHRIFAWLVALACLFGAGVAAAQYAEPKAQPTEADIEGAKKHMGAGVDFLRDPDGAKYEEAYPEFRKAYELSASLNALQNLALCAMKLELDGEAIRYYEEVLKSKQDLSEDDKTQIERDLQTLKTSVAWVTLSSDRPVVKITDERTPRSGAVRRNYYRLTKQVTVGLHPGSHKLVAKADGHPDQTWSIEIKNGGKYNHEFVFDKSAPLTVPEDKPGPDIKPDPEPKPDEGASRPIPVYVWIAGGAAIAAGIGGGVVAGLASSANSDYTNNIRGKAPEDEQQAAVDGIKTKNLVADILFGVAGAAAVTTVVLFVLRPDAPQESSASAGRSLAITPLAGPKVGGALITGRF